jgi:hypothetical protein
MICYFFARPKISNQRKGIGRRLLPPQTPGQDATFDLSLNACYKVIFYLFHRQEVLLSDKKPLALVFVRQRILAPDVPLCSIGMTQFASFPQSLRGTTGEYRKLATRSLLWQNAF